MLDEQDPPGEPPSAAALEEVERAERRLEERSAVRHEQRERRLARRARWARYELPLRVLGLGALGAFALLLTLQLGGGDLGGVPNGLATLIVVVELLAPAVVAGRLYRGEGWQFAVAVGVCVFAVELVLAFLVGFLLLGLGPAD